MNDREAQLFERAIESLRDLCKMIEGHGTGKLMQWRAYENAVELLKEMGGHVTVQEKIERDSETLKELMRQRSALHKP